MIGRLDLDRRVERGGRTLAYLVASAPLALAGAIAVLALALGAALSVIGIGLPLLLGAAATCRRLVRADRRLANRFLHTQIPPLPGGVRTTGDPWRRSLELLSDRVLLRMVVLLALKPLVVTGLLAVALAPVLLLAELLTLGLQAIGGLGAVDYFGPWAFGPPLGVGLLALALPTAVLAVATLDALQSVLAAFTRALLAPRAAPEGPVRELLAESLGDRSVNIAYWLPDRSVFVDERGLEVELPGTGSGRAWTAVEREGRRVAAIVHDAALDTSPELVQAAADASSLAIDNERLKADLRARLEELRRSRLRIVQATDEARRRIERDLHDGAQQQLVALALDLKVLKARLRHDPEAVALVEGLSERLATALAELRELARGIHPAILTDHGLGPAIAALSERLPFPVAADIAIEGRLPAPVESAAYFLVAEGLTNVAKYAHATGARVEITRAGGDVVVFVSDDGVGGVDVAAGSGLRGLQDRLATVGGTLEIDSPPGGGTRLRGRIPCPEPSVEPARPAAEEVGA